jgi:hypothetical protein
LARGIDCVFHYRLFAGAGRIDDATAQLRRIRLGEIDMSDGLFSALEKGALPAPGIVDDLVWHGDDAGLHVGAYPAHGCD